MTQTLPAQPVLAGRRALIISLILGAIAAGLVVAFLANRNSDEGGPAFGATLSVVVARQDIAPGTKLTPEMVELKDVPRDLAVAGHFTDLKAVEGEIVRYPVARGEQLSTARLVEAREASTGKALSFQIPAGLRGFTVEVETKTSPAALLVPGDFVDVIVSAELIRLGTTTGSAAPTLGDNNEKPKAAVTLLQNVQVLAVQRKYVSDGVAYDDATRGEGVAEDDDVNYVTLAVTPEQAQLLWLASQEGKITLTLRAFGDDRVSELNPVAEPIRIR